jgi:hypothetical protein
MAMSANSILAGSTPTNAHFLDHDVSLADVYALRGRIAELEVEVADLRGRVIELQQPTVHAARPQRTVHAAPASDPERDPTHAQLSKGAERRRAEVAALWQQYGEHAALTGKAPPFLRSVHLSDETFKYALAHGVDEVIGRTRTVLRREGDRLVGRCPLCGNDGLHAHPEHRTWGCRACGRFGDSYTFAVEWRRLHGAKGHDDGHH